MPKIHVVTNEGELVDTIIVDGYDLSKPLARVEILDTILHAVEIAEKEEEVDYS